MRSTQSAPLPAPLPTGDGRLGLALEQDQTLPGPHFQVVLFEDSLQPGEALRGARASRSPWRSGLDDEARSGLFQTRVQSPAVTRGSAPDGQVLAVVAARRDPDGAILEIQM